MTLSYFEIWRGIDNLAAQKGLSPSALAQKAGLDPTSFNKSKREGPDGRKRWLSMETLNKVLAATNTSFLDFMMLAGDKITQPLSSTGLPLINFSDNQKENLFNRNAMLDEEQNVGKIDFPCFFKPGMWALEMTTETYDPVYPKGSLLLIDPQTEIRRHDRIVVQMEKGPMLLGEFLGKTNENLDLKTLTTERTLLSLKKAQIAFVARILWVSQ